VAKAGQASDDANSDLTVIGSDGQVYQPSFHDTTAGTNFDSGTFHVGPGQMVRGVVNFELPHGVTVQSLQWSPGSEHGTSIEDLADMAGHKNSRITQTTYRTSSPVRWPERPPR
jgi:hypothetical protein